MNFPSMTQNFRVHCHTTLDPAAHFEQLNVRWLKQHQMVKNGLGFCVKLLPVCFHHSVCCELFLTNGIEKERKTIQKFTCK